MVAIRVRRVAPSEALCHSVAFLYRAVTQRAVGVILLVHRVATLSFPPVVNEQTISERGLDWLHRERC